MDSDFTTMQQLVQELHQRGGQQCLLWFEEQGSASMSYAETAAMAASVSRGLRKRGIAGGDRVALFAENRWQTIILALGAVHAGAVVVPLDGQFSGAVLAHVLQDASPALALASGPQAEAIREALQEHDGQGSESLPILLSDDDAADSDSWRSLLQDEDTQDAPASRSAEDTAALFYTSGTTGRPKGVPLSHGNLAFQQKALRDAGLVAPGDRMLLPLPLHHVYPFVVGMFAPLALGLSIVLPRALTGSEVTRAISEGQVSVVAGVPRLYEALLAGIQGRMDSMGFLGRQYLKGALGLSNMLRRRLGLRLGKTLLRPLHQRMGPHLEVLASGGAPLPPETAWRLEALGWQVAIGYGLTETSPILTVHPPGACRFQSVGQALQGVELRIAPPGGELENMDLESGEIQARGPGVFAGYRNLPQKSEETFTDDGWFKTGDLGLLQDGWLQVTGRVSTMIVTRGGENVQPDSVEQVLDSHRLLQESGVLEHEGRIAVLAVPDVVAARNEGLTPEEAARKAVREAAQPLPSYQRPSEVAVSLNALERTRLGKIRRHVLVDHFRQALQGEAEQDLSPMPLREMAAADRKLLQHQASRAVWELLAERFPKRRLQPDSDLAADLGMDSLAWLDLSMELSRRAGFEPDEQEIASLETVRDLLRLAQQHREAPAASGDPVNAPLEYLDAEDRSWLAPAQGWRLGLYRGLHLLLAPLLRRFFRIETSGLEEVLAQARSRALVFTPNHLSYLDIFVVVAVLPFDLLRNTQPAAWTGAAFANPVLGFFSRCAQAFPIDASKRPGTSLALGAAILDKNRHLIWFPEGMRSPDGAMLQLQPGLGRILASRNESCRVVPVCISGTFEALPKGRGWIKPVKVRVSFAPPAEVATLQEEGAGEEPARRIMSGLRKRMLDLCETKTNG